MWVLAVYERGGQSPLGPDGNVMGETPSHPAAPPAGGPARPGGPELLPVPAIPGGGGQAPQINVSGNGETGPKISMRLEDANIRDVLQLIAEQANLNISIGPTVQGSITITLTDVGLFDLLDLLGAQLGFTYIVQHGVYIFDTPKSLQEKFKNWPRWYVSLSYADPDQIRSILISMSVLSNEQIIIYRGSAATGDPNIAGTQLLITGEPRDLERAYRIVATLDQAPVMVQVDFQILNTSLTDNKNFGFQFHPGTAGYTGGTNLTFTEKPSSDNPGILPQGFTRPAADIYTIQEVINYLVEKGYAELMNRSSLTVANNQTGTLFVGETIPYRSTFQVSELGRVTQRVATQSVGLTLDFRPHANPDGTVTLALRPQNTNLLELTDVGPRTVDQRFTTTVRVKDGEPFIIGGFIKDEKRVKYDRFPFLSELPLLGNLFRNREVSNTKSELVFVFTPHIIIPQQTPPPVKTDADLQVPISTSHAGTY
jgi:type II secretory pathway component GspD/PulD (secretin)